MSQLSAMTRHSAAHFNHIRVKKSKEQKKHSLSFSQSKSLMHSPHSFIPKVHAIEIIGLSVLVEAETAAEGLRADQFFHSCCFWYGCLIKLLMSEYAAMIDTPIRLPADISCAEDLQSLTLPCAVLHCIMLSRNAFVKSNLLQKTEIRSR